MAILRSPPVRRFLAVLLVGYLLFGPVAAAVEVGAPGLPAVIPIGALTLGCCLWALRGEDLRRNVPLLALTLAGGLALNAISLYSGMGFLYVVVFAAPFKTRLWPGATLVTADLVGTTALSFALGVPSGAVWGNAAGLAYSAVFVFLLRHVKTIREHGAALAEARAGEAVLAERARLAREVHDILAHSQSAQIVHLEGRGCCWSGATIRRRRSTGSSGRCAWRGPGWRRPAGRSTRCAGRSCRWPSGWSGWLWSSGR
ncbi:histidine kinase dimerization/phosphoacceptor domain-containing protein [Streptosporangium amethystogenes subsp. fukuiense]|uniref:Histidine kinase dimerization/phosphoacceptor domain-containing protein n=1 Tax=Streptosporangium amethystogenes subsp. fukuiense TaxID=698418 RepID=A0ABW2SXM6_9ACTN